MPLNWGLEDVKNWKYLCYKEDENGNKIMNPFTHALIWALPSIGIPKITEKNYKDVYFRIRVWDLIDPPPLMENVRLITLKDVKEHIGLWTNANTISNAKFYTQMKKHINEKAETEENADKN